MPPVRCPHCGEYNNDTDTACRSCRKSIVDERVTYETPQTQIASPVSYQPSIDLNDSLAIETPPAQTTRTEPSQQELSETLSTVPNDERAHRRRSRIYLMAFLSILLFMAAALFFSYSRIKDAFVNNGDHSVEQKTGKQKVDVSPQLPKSASEPQENSNDITSEKLAVSPDYLPGENVRGPDVVPSENTNHNLNNTSVENAPPDNEGNHVNNGRTASSNGVAVDNGSPKGSKNIAKNNTKLTASKDQTPRSSNGQNEKSNKTDNKKVKKPTKDKSSVHISADKSSANKKQDIALPPEPDDNDISLPPEPDDDIALPPEPK